MLIFLDHIFLHNSYIVLTYFCIFRLISPYIPHISSYFSIYVNIFFHIFDIFLYISHIFSKISHIFLHFFLNIQSSKSEFNPTFCFEMFSNPVDVRRGEGDTSIFISPLGTVNLDIFRRSVDGGGYANFQIRDWGVK